MSENSNNIIESLAAPERVKSPRFVFLYLLLAAVMAVMLGRSFWLQVWRGSKFMAQAEGNRVSEEMIPAPRGIIYDANGKQLVENIASTDLVLDPTGLVSEDAESMLMENLPKLVPVTAEQIRDDIAKAKSTRRMVRVYEALDHDATLAVEQEQAHLPGAMLASTLVRKYQQGQEIGHITGYTSPVSADELEKRPELRPVDITGKSGIEKFYDQQLRGQTGVAYVEVNANGKPQKQLDKRDPTAGADIHLTVDTDLQNYIYSLLEDKSQQKQKDGQAQLLGAVVAMDPRSGAVRAMVSFPGYDPNIFSQPNLTDQTINIIKDERRPLFNRAADGTYPPGSTIKPVLAAAALNDGIITPQTTFLSTGGLTIGQWNFPDWKAGGHGITNVSKALAESVNTFFYLITGGDETREGLGVERATKYLEDFGWGEPTGIDLPSEASGFLPSPEWKEEAKGEQWYIGDTYHLAIGQGDVLATPLQITAGIAAIANGGVWHRPFLVRDISPPEGEPILTKSYSKKTSVNAASIRVVRNGMREVILSGSARSLSDLPIALAGKTGTAQIGGSDETHAWFTSFGPYDSPDLVVTVLVERGGGGDVEAVPIARNVWQWWNENKHE
ncbi:MAG: penicillin-binding protein 2 [Candidatus Andersenbacteria bacterium]|nr:penicillin-binding protein 2 [bacterium]MDZ4225775.1 penicillin-binding protein 2 [Candidatus Andersenbacteria bacterium]